MISIVSLLSCGTSLGVAPGDRYEQVIDELGVPQKEEHQGATSTLIYPGRTISLTDRAVISIQGKDSTATKPALVLPHTKRGTAFGAIAAPMSTEWETSFRRAQERARFEKKKILLLFINSGDHEKVTAANIARLLQNTLLLALGETRLVFVRLDSALLPGVTGEDTESNDKLSERYNVKGRPELLLVEPDGTLARRSTLEAVEVDKLLSEVGNR